MAAFHPKYPGVILPDFFLPLFPKRSQGGSNPCFLPHKYGPLSLETMTIGRENLLSQEYFFKGHLPQKGRLTSGQGHLKVLILAPNDYRIMTPNLGLASLYGALQHLEDVMVDRGFLTWPGGPLISGRSFEKDLDLFQFDLIAVSVSFELDYLNLLKILKASGIPLRRGERNEKHPFILGGGKAFTNNPFPMVEFIDLVAMGDGDALFSQILQNYKSLWEIGVPRGEILTRFKEFSGLFIPQFSQNKILPSPIKFPVLAENPVFSRLTSSEIEFPQKFLIEVERGCPYLCKFCMVGYNNRQFNRVSSQKIISSIERNLIPRKQSVGLVGSAVLSHPEIMEVVHFLDSREILFSISSLRAEKVKGDFLKILTRTGQKTITLAPETASPRLKKLIRKETPNEIFAEVVKEASTLGISNFKFYFIIGFPTETDQDALEIENFARLIFNQGVGNPIRVIFSINLFIPKPGTPFGKEFLTSEQEIKKRTKLLRTALQKYPFLKADFEGYKMSYYQNLFSTGGPLFSKFLAQLPHHTQSPAEFIALSRSYFETEYIGDRID